MSTTPSDAATLTTEDRVQFLRLPASYPSQPDDVEVKETHLSWVFLAGNQVFKLKKPVKHGFLDLSTLEARCENARREVRLNRRLAPDVYYGVVALTQEAQGRLAICGHGRVVDWLVHMRRLPAACMLDGAIASGTVQPGQIDALAKRLGSFYRRTARADITPGAYVAHFECEQDETREILLRSGVALSGAKAGQVIDRVDSELDRLRPDLETRVRDGHVVEGHGDLRPEHICLAEPPVVIDCLEFSLKLRLLDPFDELAFLGFECARLGASWIRSRLMSHCTEILKVRPTERLIAFYTAFRALVRARLTLAHLLEPDVSTPQKWRPLTRQYVAIAAAASLTHSPPKGRQ